MLFQMMNQWMLIMLVPYPHHPENDQEKEEANPLHWDQRLLPIVKDDLEM